jgi:membrane-associated phospholipid phosphatase
VRNAWLVLVLVSHVAAADPLRREHRRLRLIAAGVAGVSYAITETVFKDALAPDQCRWCNPPGFDASVRDALVWRDPSRAALYSSLTGYVAVPVGAYAALFAAAYHDGDLASLPDDALAVTEAVVYSQIVLQFVKFSVGRQRPYAHYGPHDPSNDENLSFFSGHSALAFAVVTSAGLIMHERDSPLEPVVWGVGLGLAGTTAYLRIAADKHYLSDVLLGSVYGAAVGVVIPRLTGSLPIVPTGNGLAVAGTF